VKISVHDVHTYNDRHGKVRCYFGRGTGAVPLTARPIGGPEWLRQYHAARDGQPIPGNVGAERNAEGSIAAVIAAYITSKEYLKLDDSTQRAYNAPFELLRNDMGKLSIAHLRRRQIVALLETTETANAHNSLLVAVRKIIAMAITLDFRDDDPTATIEKMQGTNPFGRAGWTLDHIAKYRKRHPLGTMARAALEIAYVTGLRVSDLCRLSRKELSADGKSFSIVPHKTRKFGTTVTQPIRDPEMIAALASVPMRGQRPFLCTVTGVDFTSSELTGYFARWCKEAGLPDEIRAHGLRKACAVRMSHAGASTHEIMAWLGDRDPKMVELYTKGRDTELLSNSGADKVAAFSARG
jgi:integrase